MLNYNPNDYSNILPSEDGITHIAISKGAKTTLGRKLDMGTRRPFQHPTDGYFESFIGWWLWRCNQKKDVFRTIHHDNMMLTAIHDTNPDTDVWKDAVETLKVSILADRELTVEVRNCKLPYYLYHVNEYMSGGTTVSDVIPVTWFTPYVNLIHEVKLALG